MSIILYLTSQLGHDQTDGYKIKKNVIQSKMEMPHITEFKLLCQMLILEEWDILIFSQRWMYEDFFFEVNALC